MLLFFYYFYLNRSIISSARTLRNEKYFKSKFILTCSPIFTLLFSPTESKFSSLYSGVIIFLPVFKIFFYFEFPSVPFSYIIFLISVSFVLSPFPCVFSLLSPFLLPSRLTLPLFTPKRLPLYYFFRFFRSFPFPPPFTFF
jgi:hypothetical protein